MWFRLVAAVAVCVALAVPAAANDGKVVLGLGAYPGTDYQEYMLNFRSLDGHHNDFTAYIQEAAFFTTHRDFDDASENGAVRILSLSPGDWEIYTTSITSYPQTLTPKTEFSIRFTVKENETVYIGDYRALAIKDSGGQEQGAVYLVSDQSARDVPLAKQKDKKIGDVTVTIPDVAAANTPLFKAAAAKTP